MRPTSFSASAVTDWVYNSPTLNVNRNIPSLSIAGVRVLNFITGATVTLETDNLAVNQQLLVISTGNGVATIHSGTQTFSVGPGQNVSLIWNGSSYDTQF
jgi:hypothetical protein